MRTAARSTRGDRARILCGKPPVPLFGAMRALPCDGWNARGDGDGTLPAAGEWCDAGSVRHVFTHFALDLAVRRYCGSQWGKVEAATPDGEWWPVDQLGEAGLPGLFAKAAALVIAHEEDVSDA